MMGIPIILDANFFFVQTGSSQSLLKEFIKNYNFYITQQVTDELKSVNLNRELIDIIKISSDEIKLLKKKVNMNNPPQDSDLSLVCAAETIQRKYSQKQILIVSNDYKLGEFVKKMKCRIDVIPVAIFAYHIAVKSDHPSLWRKLARTSLIEYLSYNRKRSSAYNIEVTTNWLVSKMADILDKKRSNIDIALSPSKDDFKQIYNVLKGVELNLKMYPYLISLNNFLNNYKSMVTINENIPHPKTISKEDIIANKIELQKTINIWNEILFAAQSLTEFDQIILNKIIGKKLVSLYKLMLEYELEGTESINFPSILINLKTQCTIINDMESLYKSIILVIIYYLKRNETELALFNAKNGLLILKDNKSKERVELAYICYQLSIDNGLKEKVSEYSEILKEYIKSQRKKTLEIIIGLGNFFFVHGVYSLAANIYSFWLTNNTNSQNIIKIFRRTIVCHKMIEEELLVYNIIPKLIKLYDTNQDIVSFFKHEKKPEIQNTDIWNNYIKKSDNKLPPAFRVNLHILSINPNRDGLLVDTSIGIFEVIIPNFQISEKIALSPYNYYIEISSKSAFKIDKSLIFNKWITYKIIFDHSNSKNYSINQL